MGAASSVEGKSAFEVLEEQNAGTSSAIIKALADDPEFGKLSKFEGDAIVSRDTEDGEKLAAGIKLSIAQGVLPELNPPPTYVTIDVIGKTPDEVCEVIMAHMGSAAETGAVVVLCGLSGTGKGTTVARLQERLPAGKTTGWSNGNVFRSLTLLAATWCEQQGLEAFDAAQALTPANVDMFMAMLHFDKFDGKWDIKISGLGLDALVSEIKNTDLKGPKVSKNIPTVAEQTQGAVVKFAANATKRMGDDGLVVILEGREATVNYIPSPFRYTLTMSDTAVLGQRRAAQRIAAETLSALGKDASPDDAAVLDAVKAQLAKMVAEIPAAA
mmetsp:Transcript_19691/g.61970  ORF Transcript_19691/g.61970 Transcript_19691/m.61970 type:complete len:328 (+) Transcript_19691:23-1006(+)